MYPLKQSTALTVPFFAHDVNGDGVTGLVDAGFTKRISKNGGAFAAMTVTITEMENGWYSLPISTAHSDTLGVLTVSLSHASIKRANLQFRVHARLPDDLAYPVTSGRSMVVDAAGLVDANTVKVGPSGSGTAQTAGDIPARLPAALVSGRMDSSVGAMANDVITAASIAAAALNGKGDWNIGKTNYALSTAGLDAIWQYLYAGQQTGLMLYQQWLTSYVRLGQIQSMTTTEIVLDAGASAIDNYYNRAAIMMVTGAAAGQPPRLVDSYVGATRTVSVPTARPWLTTGSSGDFFVILPGTSVKVAEVDPDALIEIADGILDRDMAAGADTVSRSVRNALRPLRNKWVNAAGTYTVYKEDDTTSAWTSAVSTDGTAVPIVGSDPV